jgi:hypothetical protein
VPDAGEPLDNQTTFLLEKRNVSVGGTNLLREIPSARFRDNQPVFMHDLQVVGEDILANVRKVDGVVESCVVLPIDPVYLFEDSDYKFLVNGHAHFFFLGFFASFASASAFFAAMRAARLRSRGDAPGVAQLGT